MRFSFGITTAIVLLSNLFSVSDAKKSDDGKCRILSFRGGGVHGSYEVGALKAIVEGMAADEIRYDYVSGVSVGALNASIFATFAPG